jgi:hypothetical protein
MKTRILIVLMVLSFAIIVRGDNFEQIEILQKENRKIALQMHKKRVELIKNTPSLKELQKKIISLHKELAIRIDNNSAMRKLIEKQKDIVTKIKTLEKE